MRRWIDLIESAFTDKQKLFFVPIRYWETQEPETGHLVIDGDHPYNLDSAHVYVFHDGYGHGVYMDRNRTFATREEAIARANEMKAEKDAEEDRQLDLMMQRMHGTAPEEPKEPRGSVFVPDVGTIVENGEEWAGKMRTWRVDGWLKTATPPPPAPKNPHDADGHMASLLQHILHSTQQEVGPDNKKLVNCVRNEAEYLSCSGVSGAIIRVTDAKVVGRVSWPEDQIEELRASALRRVGRDIY